MPEKMQVRKDTEIQQEQENRFLTFQINGESYAIGIYCVIEIVKMQEITKMPLQPDYIRGIINLRGKIIPVLDLKLRLGEGETQSNGRTCIVIINNGGSLQGLLVDGVSEVLTIPPEGIEPARESGNYLIHYIGKSEQGITFIIDCDALAAHPSGSQSASLTL